MEPSWGRKSIKIDPKRHRKNDRKKKASFWSLEASWRRLGASWSSLGRFVRVHRRARVCRWRERRGLLLRILRNFPDILRNISKEKEFRILLRVWDSVRHAQAQGLARRISNAQQSFVPATALTFKFLPIAVGNLTKNRQKFDATSSKIHQKSTKNH